MFYALATQQDFLKDNLYTFAALDPCTIAISEGTHIYEDGLFHFEEYGIHVFGGPDWEKSQKIICDNFDDEICKWATDYGYGEPVSV
jgi:hypothetical protein|mmetsp:Transcript_35128/g.46253  ORF Transcript_35128/g.46253 Transcript_35128/m.46253 type:complete len:87 (+) Transcript_35128:612-872(+)